VAPESPKKKASIVSAGLTKTRLKSRDLENGDRTRCLNRDGLPTCASTVAASRPQYVCRLRAEPSKLGAFALVAFAPRTNATPETPEHCSGATAGHPRISSATHSADHHRCGWVGIRTARRWRGGRFSFTSLIRRRSLEGLTVVRYDDVNMDSDVSGISMSINNGLLTQLLSIQQLPTQSRFKSHSSPRPPQTPAASS
jgi:hypothetical protein